MKKKKLNGDIVPYTHRPVGMNVEEWQTALRRQCGEEQRFKLENIGEHPVISDFKVENPLNNKSYKVAIRGEDPGMNFCSCPDFAVNTLGTCKHIEFALGRLRKQKGAMGILKSGLAQSYSSVYLRYGFTREVVLRIGTHRTDEFKKLAQRYFDSRNILRPDAFYRFEEFVASALKLDPEFQCRNDALDYIIEMRDSHRRIQLIGKKYADEANYSQLDRLIKTNLYPYQREGILFAAGAGRCLIGDDMGLGKTIQALGAAELMAKEYHIEKVLIVCPTTLKYQWQSEIDKFTNRSVQIIEGGYLKRKGQYEDAGFFTIASYNVIKNDIDFIRQMSPDLVILDEAQRIKNWKTVTAKSVKQIQSPYAIVLTGTPLENRLEELHSIVEFIDRFRLGPVFRFLANHQVLDEDGKVTGYKNLNRIGETLSSILIRRNKKEVLTQLPERIDKNFFVPITDEQWKIHEENYKTVVRLVHKWRRFKFLIERERQILLICLNCMRMVSDDTFILDEQTKSGNKINELMIFLKEVFERKEEKVVIFSQWERMTRLVAERLRELGIGFQNLYGGVLSKNRKALLDKFRDDPECRVFLSTDAGGVGLNLQSASIVINLDLPWNPAVLEQRIARVHRLGQHRPVNVINFISEGTIEQKMLGILKFKKSIFDGVLDGGAGEVFMSGNKLNRFMDTVEEITKTIPQSGERTVQMESPVERDMEPKLEREDESKNDQPVSAADNSMRELFSAGAVLLEKLNAVVSKSDQPGKPFIASLVEKDERTGKQYIKLPLPDNDVLTKAADMLSELIKMFQK